MLTLIASIYNFSMQDWERTKLSASHIKILSSLNHFDSSHFYEFNFKNSGARGGNMLPRRPSSDQGVPAGILAMPTSCPSMPTIEAARHRSDNCYPSVILGHSTSFSWKT